MLVFPPEAFHIFTAVCGAGLPHNGFIGMWVQIYLNLKKTGDNLELLAGGLAQINQNTVPLGEGIGQLNGGLSVLLEEFKAALSNLSQLTKSSNKESTPNRKSVPVLAGVQRGIPGGSKHWAPPKKS